MFNEHISVGWFNWYDKMILGCLQPQWALLWSLGFLTLGVTELHAATPNNVLPPVVENGNTLLPLTKEVGRQQMVTDVMDGDMGKTVKLFVSPVSKQSTVNSNTPESGIQPFLIAAPNNLTPPPPSPPPSPSPSPPPPPPPSPPPPSPSPPPHQPSPPKPTPPARKPSVAIENIYTNFRHDNDNFGQVNQIIEPTVQFRLRNGDIIRFRTGYESFHQNKFQDVTNFPLTLGYETKINQVTVQGGVGVDLFNRLPTALNFNAKVDVPIRRNVTLSGVLEEEPYKSSAQTLQNEVTALRYGPQLYWQIDSKTYLFSLLRLGNYNDGNSEEQSFTRIERKLGIFYLAVNLFNWSFTHDAQDKKGYFSPPDFIVFTGEVGLEGNIFDFLRCRVDTSQGGQRLNGKYSGANSYEGRCTIKFLQNVDADFGYLYSNVQNRGKAGSAYNNSSFTGQLRLNF